MFKSEQGEKIIYLYLMKRNRIREVFYMSTKNKFKEALNNVQSSTFSLVHLLSKHSSYYVLFGTEFETISRRDCEQGT